MRAKIKSMPEAGYVYVKPLTDDERIFRVVGTKLYYNYDELEFDASDFDYNAFYKECYVAAIQGLSSRFDGFDERIELAEMAGEIADEAVLEMEYRLTNEIIHNDKPEYEKEITPPYPENAERKLPSM